MPPTCGPIYAQSHCYFIGDLVRKLKGISSITKSSMGSFVYCWPSRIGVVDGGSLQHAAWQWLATDRRRRHDSYASTGRRSRLMEHNDASISNIWELAGTR